MKKIKDKEKFNKKNINQDELIIPNDHYYLKKFLLTLFTILIIGGLIYGLKKYFYDNAQYGFNKYINQIYQELNDEYHYYYHGEDKVEYLLTINSNQQDVISKYVNKTTFQGSVVYKDKQFINYLNTKSNNDITNYQILSNYENNYLKNQISIIDHEFTFNNTVNLNLDFISLFKEKYHFKENIGEYNLERNNKYNEYSLKLSKENINEMFDNELLSKYFDNGVTITIKTKGLILEKINLLTIEDQNKKIEIDLINNVYKYDSNKINIELDKKDILNWHVKISNNRYLLRGDIILSKSSIDDYIIIPAYQKKLSELKIDNDLLELIKILMK